MRPTLIPTSYPTIYHRINNQICSEVIEDPEICSDLNINNDKISIFCEANYTFRSNCPSM